MKHEFTFRATNGDTLDLHRLNHRYFLEVNLRSGLQAGTTYQYYDFTLVQTYMIIDLFRATHDNYAELLEVA